MTTISIEVDKDLARSFLQASVDEKQQLNFLLNLRLKELIATPHKPLGIIMDEMGHYAELQGITPEMLASLLNEE